MHSHKYYYNICKIYTFDWCVQEEELQSTSRNYEQQLGVLTEHVAALNEHIARQHERLQLLQRDRGK